MSAARAATDNDPRGGGNGTFPTGFIVIRLAKRRTNDSPDLRVVAREDGLRNLEAFLAANPQLRAARVIRHASPQNVRERERLASRRARAPLPSLTAYWRIDARGAGDAESIRRALLAMRGEVEIAYHEAEVRRACPTGVSAQDDPLLAMQGYLEAKPKGIGAVGAWAKGCKGSGVNVIDLESDWILDHEDLPAPQLLCGDREVTSADARDHGAASLGVVGAMDNAVGVVGVAPKLASLNVVSHYDAATYTNLHVADAVDAAALKLGPGDILLLEVQRYDGNKAYPTETDSADWLAIRLAVDQGIVVVEAAGNGDLNLDDWPDPNEERTLSVKAGGFVDSGAIMVGSAFDTVLLQGGIEGHRRYDTSNFGSRVNVYAWGEHIYTAGYGSAAGVAGAVDSYASNFGHTSGAAAIIAGAAAVVQSWVKSATGEVLTSEEMRARLSEPSTSTPQVYVAEGRVGVMPDLTAIVHGGLPLKLRIKRLLRRIGLIPRRPRDRFRAYRQAHARVGGSMTTARFRSRAERGAEATFETTRRSTEMALKSEYKGEGTAATVNLKLDLDVGRNPAVDVDDRKKKAKPGDTIRWQRHDTQPFEIVEFKPSGPGTAFSEPEIGGNGQWVKCTYQPPDPSDGKEFEYTIEVTYDGEEYDTTERDRSGGPADRRPVIRN